MASPRKDLTVAAKKPLSVFKKPVKLAPVKLAGALVKAIYDVATLNVSGAVRDLEQALEAIGLGTDPGELAWTLVVRALGRGVFDLLEDSQPLPSGAAPPDREAFTARLEQALGDRDLTLDPGFFSHPAGLPVLELLSAPLSAWLIAQGASEPDARAMVRRLPAYFTYALHQEWQARPQAYAPLLAALDGPFREAGERERAWERYAARLQRQINEPMLGEAFGIAHVYVPLRGFFEEKAEPEACRGVRHEAGREVVRHVVAVEEVLKAWVEAPDKQRPALRVLAGGPGSGKSSVAKMFAAQQSALGRRVLYVPLHLIDPEKDLESALGAFVKEQEILPDNPLEAGAAGGRLLLLLDGLDELAMQGKAAADVARDFVVAVRRVVDNRNHDGVRLQVLLGGRDVVVQMSASELREPGQVLHLLPYHVPEYPAKEYRDPRKLLKVDQRDAFWRGYAACKGKDDQAMPAHLRRRDLDEITAQPLLGYLVALSYERGEVDFSKGSALDRNVIYQDLIRAVYERTYAGKQHPAVSDLKLEEFVELLEEVGLSTWHGDGRTTTIAAIQRLCQESGLDRLLDRFQEGAEHGATRLLTAFYFRQRHRRSDGQRTFEFTHKSFGEYLAARRIVRALETMHEETAARASRPGRGWNDREALRHWAEICGPSAMDQFILAFLVGELQGKEKALAGELQRMLAMLIGYLLVQGMPMELLQLPTYGEQARQARNAEEALLAGLHACAERTEELSDVAWPEGTSFGAWLRRLQGQRTGMDNVVALRSLTRLKLSEQDLIFLDAVGANLTGTDLRGVDLYGAGLHSATLVGANLEGAHLEGTNLVGAHLERAHLERAHLERANLEDAHLEGANLEGANLEDAHLECAHLERAHLERAHLERANLRGANLRGANLRHADIEDADLEDADLEGADLERADLRGTLLEPTPVE